MNNEIVARVLKRAEREKADSDFSYLFSLLLAGETVLKVAVAGVVASLSDDKDRHRYRLEHLLLRADGIGDWSQALNDALGGPASHCLPASAYPLQAEFTRACKVGDWQYEAARKLNEVLTKLGIETEEIGTKCDLRRWFRGFPTLRNKSRAHGAITTARASAVADALSQSIVAVAENLGVLKLPWAHLHRNFSGKYRVSEIGGDCRAFAPLRISDQFNYPSGVYLYLDTPRRSCLVRADAELQDFMLANGCFSGNTCEFLSYATDNRVKVECLDHLTPPGRLPASHTEGLTEFEQLGRCLSNAPHAASDYVARSDLEARILEFLTDTKREVVTLKGPGGIGKTSVALRALASVANTDRFDVIVWFSARDIDLELAGPKPVRTHLTTAREICDYFVALTAPEKSREAGFNPITHFESQLQKCDLGACLFVFDNFETTQGPGDLAAWLDTHIRRPNKILITTRKQEFRGDYPLEVGGMTDDEARTLVQITGGALGIAELLTPTYIERLISESWAHPYVMKILLGEVAKERRAGNITRLVAGRDEILTALFERTYASLSPASQRAFMTLSAWDSAVPRLMLLAVMSHSIEEPVDMEAAIDVLVQYSLVQVQTSVEDDQAFLEVPLAARLFARRKLAVSPLKQRIEEDAQFLQQMGPSSVSEQRLGLDQKVRSLLTSLARRQDGEAAIAAATPALEMICRGYPKAWVILGRWYSEVGGRDSFEKAKEAFTRYLEHDSASQDAAEAWRGLAYCCHKLDDRLAEIHAFISRCEISSVPYWDISATANKFNEFVSQSSGSITADDRRSLADRILGVMDSRRAEAEADDYSRMAWIAIHARRNERAKRYVEHGLKLEPDNYHLQRLEQRLASWVD
jgi:tetratricopeptide (TPR) repeat protein